MDTHPTGALGVVGFLCQTGNDRYGHGGDVGCQTRSLAVAIARILKAVSASLQIDLQIAGVHARIIVIRTRSITLQLDRPCRQFLERVGEGAMMCSHERIEARHGAKARAKIILQLQSALDLRAAADMPIGWLFDRAGSSFSFFTPH